MTKKYKSIRIVLEESEYENLAKKAKKQRLSSYIKSLITAQDPDSIDNRLLSEVRNIGKNIIEEYNRTIREFANKLDEKSKGTLHENTQKIINRINELIKAFK